ncbi:SUKH-4 family immunity protein [Cellulomonas palmilytica]|uniref:SUKH-4 family immunity protein n=1 Tax=Cellulomonas palmilytica TaxID=2608402 RepID=UPI001F2FEE6A|nr:SUKH-4 family immunity protein [Cellulomonas palmilytica]UJP40254.1 SUKH-4 family immunity protein [Cellulomonas palmilytica]
MTTTKTWDQEDHTIRGLSRTDQDFLVGAGLALGTFGYLEVRPAMETTAEGVALAYDSDIAIVCTSSGVVAAEPEGPRLVNTTAESFAASMHRMARYTREVRAAEDDDEALDIVHATIGELREIDPAAWARRPELLAGCRRADGGRTALIAEALSSGTCPLDTVRSSELGASASA